MICKECELQVEDSAKFCPKCGSKIEEKLSIQEEETSKAEGDVPSESDKNQSNESNLPKETEIQKTIEEDNSKDTLSNVVVKKKKPWLLPVLIVGGIIGSIILIEIIVAGIWGIANARSKSYDKQIALGDKYISEMDYDKAILAYKKAISASPRKPEGYLGLADAYIANREFDAAKKTLKKGIRKTHDEELQNKLDELEKMLSIKATVSGVVLIADEDTNYSNNEPLEGAEIELKLPDGTTQNTTTDKNGAYVFSGLKMGKYQMLVQKAGYYDVTHQFEIYEYQEEVYNSSIEMVSEKMAGKGTASGIIYDALTRAGVGDLTLEIYKGYNVTDTKSLDIVNTDSDGNYKTPDLDAGIYCIEIKDNRGLDDSYMTSVINVKVLGNRNTENQNGTVSTGLNVGQLRIVLSWGDYPNDLDSHLYGELEDGQSIHTWYSYFDAYDSYDTYERIAALDLDDTDMYGPETTTIYSNKKGEYTFVVHDYSANDPTDIAKSGAVVQIYKGLSSIPSRIFYAPQSSGYYWEVFTYNSRNGSIKPINKVTDY